MQTGFIATSLEEAQQVFGDELLRKSLIEKQVELDERVQLGVFLQKYAHLPDCTFPIVAEVRKRDRTPDFKVIFGNTEVGIETSKIAGSEVEQLRTLQRKKGLGSIEISSLLQGPTGVELQQRVNDCTGNLSFIFADTNEEQRMDEFWLKQAMGIIDRKHEISKKPTFDRYEESWLLLWDRLECASEDLKRRAKMLDDLLARRWKDDFFRRVIIQKQHQPEFLMLTRRGVQEF